MANVANMIPVDALLFANNVRSPECLQLDAMVESYRRHGFKVNHPLVVSDKGEKGFLVLCGNRRGLALHTLRDTDPDAYRRACKDGKVPAIVHKNLTVEEEVDLRIDHSVDEDRVALDDWSVFMAIRQLVKVGFDTQEKIAEKLGLFHIKGKNKGKPNRSIVQPRVNLSRLPAFVQEEVRKYTLDAASTPLRWSMIATLYKAYSGEFAAFPEGNGPLFKEAWEKAITPVERVETVDNGKASLSPADAVKRAQACSSKALKTGLLVVTGQSDADLAQVDAVIAQGETAVILLEQVREYLGDDDYAELIANSQGEPVEVPA